MEKQLSLIHRFYKMMIEIVQKQFDCCNYASSLFNFFNTLQPEWSSFVSIVKQQHRIAKNANPLALVCFCSKHFNATIINNHKRSLNSYAPTSKALLPTRSHATTRHKGKEIAKPITPPSESASEEDIYPEQAQRDKDM
ncbi:hypothetical protein Tco_1032387 [Tanacetum coccineum]|uniref:THAP-type domain-containing protein n=1 Tax=Tanacetum coccineum TaxID=301880 RepID=A0ABQ5GC52_9ASTR